LFLYLITVLELFAYLNEESTGSFGTEAVFAFELTTGSYDCPFSIVFSLFF